MEMQDVLPRDAIPSIDDPSFDSTYFGDDDDDVMVVESDPVRAYPVRVLSYHEIVNDVLAGSFEPAGFTRSHTNVDEDGLPIAVTWCPICASGVVYVRGVDDRRLTFGTAGKLADDALVMYDRETESEWKQPLGKAISGSLEGRELESIPAPLMSWRQFRDAYPDGVVLQAVHGSDTDSRGRTPREAYEMTHYDEYDAASAFGLRAMRGEGPERTWDREDVDPKATVLGIVHDGDAVGYPLPQVRAAGGVIVDSVGGLDVLVVSDGGEMHAFEHPGGQFERNGGTLHGDGTSWNPTTGAGRDGRRLVRVPTRRLYAFAWQDDHGRESFYGL
jgi:hypothetical protein